MNYKVEYTRSAIKQLKRMDRQTVALIISYIERHLLGCENPRLIGKPLHGNLRDKWRYRVGNYRILARINDDQVVIVVVEIGHRKDIYR